MESHDKSDPNNSNSIASSQHKTHTSNSFRDLVHQKLKSEQHIDLSNADQIRDTLSLDSSNSDEDNSKDTSSLSIENSLRLEISKLQKLRDEDMKEYAAFVKWERTVRNQCDSCLKCIEVWENISDRFSKVLKRLNKIVSNQDKAKAFPNTNEFSTQTITINSEAGPSKSSNPKRKRVNEPKNQTRLTKIFRGPDNRLVRLYRDNSN